MYKDDSALKKPITVDMAKANPTKSYIFDIWIMRIWP